MLSRACSKKERRKGEREEGKEGGREEKKGKAKKGKERGRKKKGDKNRKIKEHLFYNRGRLHFGPILWSLTKALEKPTVLVLM